MISVHVNKRQGDFVIQTAFEAPCKGVTALFGPSGAGKTSIINMVAGLLQPDHGHIEVNGQVLFDSKKGIHLPPEQRRVGYVFQEGRLFPHLSVRANLTYGMRRTPPDQRYVTPDQVTALLGIDHLLDRRPARLSGGEKQRVAMGRALLTSPSLLLMDEPLASLDESRKAEVLPFISRLADEFAVPIIYVTHVLDEIMALADMLIVMEQGKVLAADRLEALMMRPNARRYLGHGNSGALFNTIVEKHEEGLTCLKFAGGVLKVPRGEWASGSRLRVYIKSRHVAVSLTPPANTSFQNILPATVKDITESDGNLVNVYLDMGCLLTAQVTRKALSDLGLKPGLRVFALIKGVGVAPATVMKELT